MTQPDSIINHGQSGDGRFWSPRQRAMAALERRRPEGPVPTCELAFGLFSDWLGRPVPGIANASDLEPGQRACRLQEFVHDTVAVYRQLDHSIITHWVPDEQLMADLIQEYRQQTADEFMLGFPADGTRGLPADGSLEEFSFRLVDEPQAIHEESKRAIDAALKKASVMKRAGADVVWMGSDYAMNSGPFLSPDMFAEFVAPYLTQVIAGFKSLGLYVIKHSDGDLNPILDQIVDAGPHAIHSLDAIANMDIRDIKQRYGDRVALIGNVPHGPLQMKQYDVVEQAARYALTYGGVASGGYIYSTSNAVFGGEITGITAEAYRFMLGVRDAFMKEYAESQVG